MLVPASLAPTTDDANKLQLRVAATVYVVRATTVAGVMDDIASLGLMTDHSQQARAVGPTRIQTDVDAVTKAVSSQPRVRCSSTSASYTIEPGAMPSDLIRLAQGENVAAEADPSQPFTVAELVAAAPEVQSRRPTREPRWPTCTATRSWRSLPAAQQKRVVAIPQTTLYEDGPRVGDAGGDRAGAASRHHDF